MSRNTKIKELSHTRLANQYGGWIYCESCGENIGYLCYTTYDNFSSIISVNVKVVDIFILLLVMLAQKRFQMIN